MSALVANELEGMAACYNGEPYLVFAHIDLGEASLADLGANDEVADHIVADF